MKVVFSETETVLPIGFSDNTEELHTDFDYYITGGGGTPYEGPYEVTPTKQTQTLFTAGKLMGSNVTVNPIPQNYGLITYDGVGITVS